MTRPEAAANILIVEDTLGIAQALHWALGLHQNGKYQVESCETGEAALKRLNETSFDLLISDLSLPGIDGLELLKRARLLKPGIRTMLITAFGSPEIEERARNLADAYLPKPFRLRDLLRQVDRLLSEPEPAPTPFPGAAAEAGAAAGPPAMEKRKNAHLLVLACDLDGTLIEQGKATADTWETLRLAKIAGLVLILVTGRTLDSFTSGGPFTELFEAIVAENGAAVYFSRRDAVALPFGTLEPAMLKRLEALSVPLERGIAMAASRVPHDELVLKVLRESRSGGTIEYNRDAVMLLPAGASKGNGLLYALQELGYSPHNVVACGDAENDRSFFKVAELGVAVSNARPALKAVADAVLPLPDGEGVRALIKDLLEGRTPGFRPRPERRLLLGYRISGAPLYLDPFSLVESNTGIFGSSGSGKSWLAGLLAEELLKQKYQICIIDPEGDYRSLGISPQTLVLGGAETPLPPVSDVLNINEWNNASLVLDLSTYSLEARNQYVAEFLSALRDLRGRRGRPHCFLVDEIQSFCPPGESELKDLFLEALQWGGFIFISYRPSQVAPELLAALDHCLLTRTNLPEEIESLQAHLCSHGDCARALSQLPMLPRGQALLCLSPAKRWPSSPKGFVRFNMGPRMLAHIRHLHKYLRAPLPESKRFYFRDKGGRYVGYTVANLWEFREALRQVPLELLHYHMEKGDFERWLEQVLHDEELARRVHKIAHRQLEGEALRQALLEVVIDRYEELDSLT